MQPLPFVAHSIALTCKLDVITSTVSPRSIQLARRPYSCRSRRLAANLEMPKPMIVSFIIFLFLLLTSQVSDAFSFKSAPRFLNEYAKPRTRKHSYRYETRNFSQTLDHFSFSYHPKFQQRYLISTENWIGPARMGPIFFYCGNEGDIEWFAANTGFVWEVAPRFGAMVVFPEVSNIYLCFLFSDILFV